MRSPRTAGTRYLHGRSVRLSFSRFGANALTFVNEHRDIARGRLLNASQLVADGWGGLMGTLHGNQIQWANNTTWSVPHVLAEYSVDRRVARIGQVPLVGLLAAEFRQPEVENLDHRPAVWPLNSARRLPSPAEYKRIRDGGWEMFVEKSASEIAIIDLSGDQAMAKAIVSLPTRRLVRVPGWRPTGGQVAGTP